MRYVTVVLFPVFLLFSCTQNTDSDNTATSNLNLDAFAWIRQLNFTTTYQDLQKVLPENKEVLLNSDEAVEYAFQISEIPITVKALYYGEQFFTMLRLDFDFSSFSDKQIEAYQYFGNLLREKYGEAIFDDQINGEDALVFEEITMDDVLLQDITLQMFGNNIVITYTSRQNPDPVFENGTEGEWVQRGEDGEWVWMPY